MAYKQPSSGLPFKELGSSPAKQKDYTQKEWEGEGPTRGFDDTVESGSPNAPLEGFTKRKANADVEEQNIKDAEYRIGKVSIKKS